ncbi:ubiquitin carboxyl-terminal hydrolase 22 [Trichonephila clavipes]|nr:ubiquitin carboxyl-terminal hydrolase 22 [Trichonephila clavipes]
MDFTEINSRGKQGELLGRIDRQNSCFRTAKTIIIKFGLHAYFVELESAKNAVNERLAPNSIRKVCNKNSIHVMFPEFLDMTPFMSSTNCLDQTVTEESVDLTNSKHIFTLFAVVSHRGDKTGGHYISYIRQHRDKWYFCDDDTIVRCSLEEVLESEGYILFYHKQVLEYGENNIPINETVDQS